MLTKEKREVQIEFDKEKLRVVKECVRLGYTYGKIAQTLGISVRLLNYYMYESPVDLSAKVEAYKAEIMLEEAEEIGKKVFSIDWYDKKVNVKTMEIAQREAMFLREKLRVAGSRYETKTQQIINVVAPLPILGAMFDR